LVRKRTKLQPSGVQGKLVLLYNRGVRPCVWPRECNNHFTALVENPSGHISNTSGGDFKKGQLLQQSDDFRMARTCRNIGGRLAFLVNLARVCTVLQQDLDGLGMPLLRCHHQC
jgi:hypothetical protein